MKVTLNGKVTANSIYKDGHFMSVGVLDPRFVSLDIYNDFIVEGNYDTIFPLGSKIIITLDDGKF